MNKSRIQRVLAACALGAASIACQAQNEAAEAVPPVAPGLQPHYLEIVTPEVDATISSLEASNGVTFGEPVAHFGGARTAPLANGGLMGVRAPMHAAENSVVRPYLLVDDIDAAVENATAAGGQLAMPPTPIEGSGKFAIYFLGGIEHGLWQL